MAMLEEGHSDAYFVQMVTLIADRHGCDVEIDIDNRSVSFPLNNTTRQLVDDMMVLFDKYYTD